MFKDRADVDHCSLCQAKSGSVQHHGCMVHTYCTRCCERLKSQPEPNQCLLCLRIEVNQSYELKMIQSIMNGNVSPFATDVCTSLSQISNGNDECNINETTCDTAVPDNNKSHPSTHQEGSLTGLTEDTSGIVCDDPDDDWDRASTGDAVCHCPELARLCGSSCSDIDERSWSDNGTDVGYREDDESDGVYPEMTAVEGPKNDDDYYHWVALSELRTEANVDPFWDN